MSVGILASIFPEWRKLTLALYAPQFLSIGVVLMLNESVRWTLNKGHYDKAETLLHKIAKANDKDISSETLKLLRQTYEEKKFIKSDNNEPNESFLLSLLKNKIILQRFFVCSISWITTSLLHYGLSLNATSISGNKYINYAAAQAIEIPSFWVGIYLLNKIGRKPVLSGAFLLCAVTQAIYVFVPKENYALALSVYLLSKFASGIIHLTHHLYTTELYPTQHRHRFFASLVVIGRVGAITGPLTPAFAAATFPAFPFVLFGSCALLAGLLTLLLPETRGIQLPDTLREAAHIGKDKK